VTRFDPDPFQMAAGSVDRRRGRKIPIKLMRTFCLPTVESAWSIYARNRHVPSSNGGPVVQDLLYLILGLGVFAAFALAIEGCERI
jgi:hypothetical protein